MTRPRLAGTLRVLFLAAVAGGVWWGWRRDGNAVLDALGELEPLRLATAACCVVMGLLLTGVLWRALLAAHGYALSPVRAAAIFFVGQLGKYVPGAVWSIGAQAQMAHRNRVPLRPIVSTSLLFLCIHVGTGLLVGSALVWMLPLSASAKVAVGVFGAGAGGASLSSPVLVRLGRRVSGGTTVTWGTAPALRVAGLMLVVWALYGGALVLCASSSSVYTYGTLTAAYALAYAVGVAVPVAPAGVGAREAVFLLLTSPLLGVPQAAALALVARLVHTVADVALAAVAWILDRIPESTSRWRQ